MASRRRTFQRPLGDRRYRRLFVIAVEGAVTEPQYFSMLDNQNAAVKIKTLRSRSDSAPTHVLQRMKRYLMEESLTGADEAWLVVDRDDWPEEHLDSLWQWSTEKTQRGLALSNPSFELWLLLHFEDGAGVSTKNEIVARLKRYLPNYDKSIDGFRGLMGLIDEALKRAKRRDNPASPSWPRSFGITTVYRLVESIRRS